MLSKLIKTHLAKTLYNVVKVGIRHQCNVPTVIMNNGNEMPAIGFGTWSSSNDFRVLEKVENIDQLKTNKNECKEIKKNSAIVAQAVSMAIDAGYRHIDGAHLYKNEREIGEVYKEKIECGVVTRYRPGRINDQVAALANLFIFAGNSTGKLHTQIFNIWKIIYGVWQLCYQQKIKKLPTQPPEELFITSKLWNTFHHPENVCSACRRTLDNLGLDYLDMYLMHTPMGFDYSADDLFPMCDGDLLCSDVDYIDTWLAMEELVEKDMCKNIGISNFNIEQIARLLKKCKIIPQTLQIEIHPYLTQRKLVKFAKCNDICVTAYAPLGSPNRPWAKDIKQKNLLTDKMILKMAEKYQRTPGQILLRYQIQRGHATIPASKKKTHIEENIKIFDFKLTTGDIRNIESLDCNERYFKFTGAYGHPYFPFETCS